MDPTILELTANTGVQPQIPGERLHAFAARLGEISGLQVYPASVTAVDGLLLFLGSRQGRLRLMAISRPGAESGLQGETCGLDVSDVTLQCTACAPDAASARSLRARLEFLRPKVVGLRKSAGCGDRLGNATPGHIRALRRSDMAAILAQQSIRENARTGRTPQQVIDEAMWGVLQEGWREGYGADADHLKTTADIDVCADAGYTFYTFDPGDHVDNRADAASAAELETIAETLPWPVLDTSRRDFETRLSGRRIALDSFDVVLEREDLLRAAVKYGRALAHVVGMHEHLVGRMARRPFELEISVDETESVTSVPEHVYIAHELTRLGVRWSSLAPRYVGRFEKGVDYIGNTAEFESSFARHFAVASVYGPYKLSLHSGSDKFSIYPSAARVAGELVHLKTAGTSYLEALRTVAGVNPALFRKIMRFAETCYPADRASYHVSADLERVPKWEPWEDGRLPELLDHFHARQVLHVTYGSVLNNTELSAALMDCLRGNPETYYGMLDRHFERHLAPFGSRRAATL